MTRTYKYARLIPIRTVWLWIVDHWDHFRELLCMLNETCQWWFNICKDCHIVRATGRSHTVFTAQIRANVAPDFNLCVYTVMFQGGHLGVQNGTMQRSMVRTGTTFMQIKVILWCRLGELQLPECIYPQHKGSILTMLWREILQFPSF